MFLLTAPGEEVGGLAEGRLCGKSSTFGLSRDASAIARSALDDGADTPFASGLGVSRGGAAAAAAAAAAEVDEPTTRMRTSLGAPNPPYPARSNSGAAKDDDDEPASEGSSIATRLYARCGSSKSPSPGPA